MKEREYSAEFSVVIECYVGGHGIKVSFDCLLNRMCVYQTIEVKGKYIIRKIK